MNRLFGFIALFAMLLVAKPTAAATSQLLVQSNLGRPAMSLVCLLRGCQVVSFQQGSPSNYFVVSTSSSTDFLTFLLKSVPGILNVQVLGGGSNPVGTRYIVRTSGGL